MQKQWYAKGMKIWLFSLFIAITPWMDWAISQWFYSRGQFVTHPAIDALYFYGAWPALFIGIVATIMALIAYLFPRRRHWLFPSLYLSLTLAIGPGLIIHGILKESWGRPRPREIREWGGNETFRPVFLPQWREKEKPARSFASGHASTGFYFFTFVFLGRRYRNSFLERAGWILALSLGILISFARIAVGAHFFTDTLAAGLIMWYLAKWLDQWGYQRVRAIA